MKLVMTLACTVVISSHCAAAEDWPQWRGPNRDGKSPGFEAPKTWPKELIKQWTAIVGEGVATPALVDGKLYVFSREQGNEIIRCLNASTGEELWRDHYEALGASGGARNYSGPRSSPAVAEGKVVTLGVRGMLSCYDANAGTKLWRKETGKTPTFFAASSPIIVDGRCIAQVGDEREGGIVAYDLSTGEEKWSWSGDGPGYASPVLLTLAGVKMLLAETAGKLVGLNSGDGKLLWETPYAGERRSYNASTPLVTGSTLIFSGSGRGTKALKLEKQGDELKATDLWNNSEQSAKFNTPVLKDGLLFGLSEGNDLFCINAQTGQTAWAIPVSGDRARDGEARQGDDRQGRGGRGGRGGGGGGGYGSIIDAGSVMLALTPSAELIAFEADGEAFKELARIKVAESATHAHPVPVGNSIFVKDAESVTLWTFN